MKYKTGSHIGNTAQLWISPVSNYAVDESAVAKLLD